MGRPAPKAARFDHDRADAGHHARLVYEQCAVAPSRTHSASNYRDNSSIFMHPAPLVTGDDRI